MAYGVANMIDPYRGVFKILETVSDYEEAWRRAGVARMRSPEGIYFVLSTETREDPKRPAISKQPSLERHEIPE
jgi:hypothetical protein